MQQWERSGGKGLWTEYINKETGESSIKEISPKVAKLYCKPSKHYFIPISKSSRECICKRCGIGAKYVLGLHKLEKGKITSLS